MAEEVAKAKKRQGSRALAGGSSFIEPLVLLAAFGCGCDADNATMRAIRRRGVTVRARAHMFCGQENPAGAGSGCWRCGWIGGGAGVCEGWVPSFERWMIRQSVAASDEFR